MQYGQLGEIVRKTLDDMQKRPAEYLNADYIVNPVEKLKNVVEGKEEG